MQALTNFIIGTGIFMVLFVIFAESGLMVGFFLPGDSLLFTAGFLVQQHIFHANIHLFVAGLFIAAALGESTGYWFGRKIGRRLFERQNTRFFRKENLVRAQAFYEKRGPITIVLACFVPIIRTFVPIVAGVSGMPYHKFVPFNILGAALWTATFTYLGYFAGSALQRTGINVEITAIIIILLSVSPMIFHILKDPTRRRSMWQGTVREVHILLHRQAR